MLNIPLQAPGIQCSGESMDPLHAAATGEIELPEDLKKRGLEHLEERKREEEKYQEKMNNFYKQERDLRREVEAIVKTNRKPSRYEVENEENIILAIAVEFMSGDNSLPVETAFAQAEEVYQHSQNRTAARLEEL